jgi:hypothetical protein
MRSIQPQIVIPGLDPGIHAVPPVQNVGILYGRSRMDDRVKPGHDDLGLWRH